MEKSYLYLRTSGDDGKDKAGLPVQRDACTAFAEKTQRQIAAEFPESRASCTCTSALRGSC
jgi:hypothetical protein